MSTHVFLSPEWIAAVKSIRDELVTDVGAPTIEIAANVTVTDAPFPDPTVLGHIDTTGGALIIEEGHLADSDFGIEMTYDVAREIFIDRDPQAVMSIMLGGRMKLTGDTSKVMLLAGVAAPPAADTETGSTAREILHRIDAVTAPT